LQEISWKFEALRNIELQKIYLPSIKLIDRAIIELKGDDGLEMEEYLKIDYYHNEKGEFDQIINQFSSCYDYVMYMAMKAKLNFRIDPYSIFFGSINVRYIEQNNQPKYLSVDKINSDYKFAITKEYKLKNIDAMSLLTDLLDRGEIVHITTLFSKLIYNKAYNPENVLDLSHPPTHLILILSHDDKYIYFLDHHKWSVNARFFVGHLDNKYIGVISKNELQQAFDCYFRCYTFEFDEKAILMSEMKGPGESISQIVHTYFKKTQNTENEKIYIGRSALVRLIDICEGGNLLLSQECWKEGDIFGLLNFSLSGDISNSRHRLKGYVSKHANNIGNSESKKLASLLSDSINAWEILNNVISRNYYRRSYSFDSRYIEHFQKILLLEDKINDCMREVFVHRGGRMPAN
jgi:hypothetical protein